MLLLGYGLGGLSDSVTLLEPYRNLRRGEGRSSRQTVLFNPINHSVFSLPYRAVAGFGSLVLLFVSLIVVIYPGVKIAAAGLYKVSTSDRLQERMLGLDSSLVDSFENTWDLTQSVTAGITDRASQWSAWSLIKEFNLPPRTDALDNLVFTELQGDVENAASIQAVIPAIEVQVTCQPHDNEEFSLWVTQTYLSFWGRMFSFMFRPETPDVSKTGAAMVDYYSMTMLENSVNATDYIGAAFLPVDKKTSTVLPGTPYTMLLADYSSIASGVVNKTYIPVFDYEFQNGSLQSFAIETKPGMFNVSLPTIRGVVCTREFNKVSVNATLTQGLRVELNGSSTLLPWAVADYDNRTITNRTPYNRSTPGWMYPYYPVDPLFAGPINSYGDTNDAAAGGNAAEVVGNTLWPSKGTSRNIWEQLVLFQQSKVGNDSITSSLLDVNELARTAEKVLTTYSIQMLSELRTYTSQIANAKRKRDVGVNTIPVQVYQRLPAVQQSATITYVITAMLAIVILCSLLATSPYLPFPGRKREALDLREPPGSIAAGMKLLAGSRLVQELREQGVTRTDQTNIWSRKFRLGWWEDTESRMATERKRGTESKKTTERTKVTESSRVEPEGRRWGIDVV